MHRLAAARHRELATIERAHRATGGGVAVATLTVPHRAGLALATLRAALDRALDSLRSRRLDRLLTRCGCLIGVYAVIETTYSHRAGWHCHVHCLILTNPGGADLDRLAAGLTSLWADRWRDAVAPVPALAALGLPDQRGVDVREWHDSPAAYLTKGWRPTPAALRNSGSDRPFDLLIRAAAGDRLAAARWREYALIEAPDFHRSRLLLQRYPVAPWQPARALDPVKAKLARIRLLRDFRPTRLDRAELRRRATLRRLALSTFMHSGFINRSTKPPKGLLSSGQLPLPLEHQ